MNEELEPVSASGTMTGALIASTPEQIVPRASFIAKQLAEIVRQTNASVMIGGRAHVKVEGWTTLLAMMQVQPEIEWSRPLLGADGEIAYEARVALIHWPTSKRVGSAEAEASSLEPNASKSWGRAAYSVRSMAQTRAVGKAARLGFSWVMVLAGFDPTPLEEMPADGNGGAPEKAGKARTANQERGAAIIAGAKREPNPKTVARKENLLRLNRKSHAIIAELIKAQLVSNGADLQMTGEGGTWAREKLRRELMGDVAFDKTDVAHQEAWCAALEKMLNANRPPLTLGVDEPPLPEEPPAGFGGR